MANKSDAEENEPKEHLAACMVQIIEANDRAGKPARDAIRTIVLALVHELNERGGPAQVQMLKGELQSIARDLPAVG